MFTFQPNMLIWILTTQSNVQAVAIFEHSFSGTVVGAIGEACPLSKNNSTVNHRQFCTFLKKVIFEPF